MKDRAATCGPETFGISYGCSVGGGEDGMGAETFTNVSCISLVAVPASLTGPSVPAAEALTVGRAVADATVL